MTTLTPNFIFAFLYLLSHNLLPKENIYVA